MYASIIDIQLKPGTTSQATDITLGAMDEIRAIDGVKQIISIDRGNDQGLVIAIYESQATQEAATPRAQEILGRLGDLYAAPPERQGGEVLVNESF
jgi:hypothetical protein